MYNKKIFILAFVLVLAFSCSAFGGVKVGIISKPATTEEVFNSKVATTWKWTIFGAGHGDDDKFIYYDDLSAMIMALNAGEIDEIDLPKPVAEYVTEMNPDYKVSCVMRTKPIHFVFGFLKDKNVILWQNFNYTLRNMRKDGTLEELLTKYLYNPGKIESEAVKLESFPNADTVKIAVTGDMPPIDYVAPNGNLAGFNAAILAEIGRRLKINIEIININSGARATALVSGRADGVFWFMNDIFDIPSTVLVSDPYYTFDEFLHIHRK